MLALLSAFLVPSTLVLEAILAIVLPLSMSDVQIVLVIFLFLPIPYLIQLSFAHNDIMNRMIDIDNFFLSVIS